jgi:hypothetical protein
MSDVNPFQPPRAADDSARPVPQAGVPQAIVDLLAQTRPWVTFLAVLGFVVCGFLGLAGIVGSIGGAFVKPRFALVGVVYVLLAVFYLFPSLFLMRYSRAIRKLTQGGGEPALVEAMERQKSFWRLIGIAALVMLCLYLLVLIGGIGAAMFFRH